MGSEWRCRDGELPDGPICPNCGGPRGPSGVDGGTWVHVRPVPNPTLALQLDADAGAVPGCTTECVKMREENVELRKLAYLGAHHFPDLTWKARAAELITELASLRADAEGVRAVEEWDQWLNRSVRDGLWQWNAYTSAGIISAPDLPSLGRALMARKQEEAPPEEKID